MSDKKVVCVETGMVYDSADIAAKEVGCDSLEIERCAAYNSYWNQIENIASNKLMPIDDVLNIIGKEKIKNDIYNHIITFEDLAEAFAFGLPKYLDVYESICEDNYFSEVCKPMWRIYYDNGGETIDNDKELVDLSDFAKCRTLDEFAQFCTSFDYIHFIQYNEKCTNYGDWLVKAYASVIMWYLFK